MRILTRGTSVCALAVFLLVVAGEADAAPGDVYNITSTATNASEGWGVNNTGQVAGDLQNPIAFQAFRYDGPPGTGSHRLLGQLGGGSALGTGINATAQVSGFSLISGGQHYHAFRYDGTPGSGGVMRDLGTLGGGDSVGRGVNDAGQVAGYSQINTTSDFEHAFRYDGTPGSGGVMRDLGTLGGPNSRANGINNPGQVTGQANLASGVTHAFRYDGTPGSGGVMRDLGVLGGTFSVGWAVNDSGQVAGYSDSASGTSSRAFRYDGTPGVDGVMRDLGTLGAAWSYAYGINNAGAVVGDSNYTDGNQLAVLWKPDRSIVDLDLWLDQINPVAGAKWTLRQAYDISDSGWVTGYGDFSDGPGGLSDGQRAFLLDASSLVPEPSPTALAAAALLALRRPRRLSCEADGVSPGQA